MGNCIHYKNGKYRLYSSFNDKFVTVWTNKAVISDILRDEAMRDFEVQVAQRFERAEKNGCSLIPKLIRHEGCEI